MRVKEVFIKHLLLRYISFLIPEINLVFAKLSQVTENTSRVRVVILYNTV